MARIPTGNSKVVESLTQIAHEAMSLADDLGAWQGLEAAHRACSPFQVLMVTFDPLLHHLGKRE